MGEELSQRNKLAELARFGQPVPQEKALALSPSEAFARIERAFKQSGFNYGGKGKEDQYWLGFSQGEASYARETWRKIEEIEKQAVEKGKSFQDKDIFDCYKVCLDIPLSKIPDLVELLDTQFGDVICLGKVGKPPVLERKNFPKMVLYIRGAHLNEVLDFALVLAKAVRSQLGFSEAKLIYAKEILEGSGVFLTQGTYSLKKRAKEQGRFGDYYGKDGALFKKTEARYPEYLKRRQNQFAIEESLFDYVGYEKASERLVALQSDAFWGLPEEVKRGIRGIEVRVGGYYAPRFKELPELLKDCDDRTKELFDNPRFQKDFDYAVRSVSLIYMLYILTHPLRNGNGQACTNLISSLLYEGSHEKIYFRAFLDGRTLRAKAFKGIQTTETPTEEWSPAEAPTEDLKPGEERKKREEIKINQAQDYARDFIKTATEKPVWSSLLSYAQEGKMTDFERLRSSTRLERGQRAVLESFLKRTKEINYHLQEYLSDSPTGSRELSFAGLQSAQLSGEKLLKT